MPARHEARRLHLDPLERAIHHPGRGPGHRLLAKHMPRLERRAEFEPHPVVGHRAEPRETELGKALEPLPLEAESRPPQVVHHRRKILHHEVRQHEPVMERRAPADEPAATHRRQAPRLPPQPGHKPPHDELGREPHPHVRGHLETTELDQAAAAAGRIGRPELVDAELGPVGVAGEIGEDVAEHAVGKPGEHAASRFARIANLGRLLPLGPLLFFRLGSVRPMPATAAPRTGQLLQSDLEFVEALVPGLVDPRRLAGWPDEPASE